MYFPSQDYDSIISYSSKSLVPEALIEFRNKSLVDSIFRSCQFFDLILRARTALLAGPLGPM